MPSLNEDFRQLESRLVQPESLLAGGGDPFFYFAYLTEQTMEVRRLMPSWIGRLELAGFTIEKVSFSSLLRELIDKSGRWHQWLEVEAEADPEDVNEAVRSVLRDGRALVNRVGAIVGSPRPRTVIFLTDTESLHPYFRVRVLENALHDRVKTPTVVFYPGRRAGQFGLRFLDLHDEDPNYRSTIFGGLP